MTFSKSYFSFFAGEPNDSVVLCSESAVFELKEAETSNSLLLVKDMLEGNICKELKNNAGIISNDSAADNKENAHKVTVLKTFYHYLEMKPAKPGWQKLFHLLESRIMKNYERFVFFLFT